MKNFFKVLGFLGGQLIILCLLSAGLVRRTDENVYDPCAVKSKIAQVEEEEDNTLDVLFMGDSICYSAFDPLAIWENYGFTSFVCGTSAQRICDTYAILKEALDSQSPKAVVIEATCFYRNMDKKSDTNDLVLDELTKQFDAFAYHAEWKNVIGDIIAGASPKGKRSPRKGFVGRQSVNPYNGGEYMINSPEVDEIKPGVIKYLDMIETLCREKGIRLIIVSAPSPRNWNYARHNAVSHWADASHVPYIDMNIMSKPDIDWSCDTKDGGDHLNITGAKKVSLFIGGYLSDNLKLDDKRSDLRYADWTYYSNEQEP